MRYFPSAARQRAATAVAVGALAVGLLTNPWSNSSANADDKDDLKHRHHQVKGQIHDAAADLEDASHQYAAANRRLVNAHKQLIGARKRVKTVTGQLTTARNRAFDLQRELVESRQRLAEATKALREGKADTLAQKEALRSIITNGADPGDLQLRAVGTLLSADSLDDLTRGLSAQDVVMGRSNDVYHQLQVVQAKLDDQRDDVADATAEVADKQQEAADHLVVVRGLYSDARAARKRVVALIGTAREAKQKALRVRARDRAQLRRLQKREDRIADRLRDLARNAKGGYNGKSNGFLDYPANGPITSPFGYRVHPIYGYYSLHNGTDFGVPCGTPLHAAASGTVIDEYYDSVYGNRLYLSVGNVNGKNLTLVYNHMTSYKAHEGQKVSRGDVVGYSGTTGWSTGCHLHFTVLENGTAVNPVNYL